MTLAIELRDARDDLHIIEWKVDAMLETLLPGWRRRFPATLGWRFAPHATIDVYDVPDLDTRAAAAGLRRAGFELIVLHPHPSTTFLTCICRPMEAT